VIILEREESQTEGAHDGATSEEASILEILPESNYECVRCHTRVARSELNELPSPRCSNCGFTVFQKLRPGTVKLVAAA
jgi:DNA-directed RNA polymerase subunit RPC12/RpoP